jgi:dienelactone hydrolase
MHLLRHPNLFFALLTPCLFAGPSATLHAAGLFDGTDTGGGSNTKLEPGKEVHVRDSDVAGRGYYTVYLPSDYDGRRLFPVIFHYHGQFEEPQSTPFRQITGGAGFIIIGMDYQAPEAPKASAPDKPKVGAKKILPPKTKPPANGKDQGELDAEVLRRVAAMLRSDLKIDQKQLFIAGFSQGATEAQMIAARSPELWAGVIVLGAGDAREPAMAKALTGKPILIAIGETDQDFAAARLAADAYKKLGADVTFEAFAGRGHEIDVKDGVLKQWLINYGPQRQVHTAIAAAEAAEKSNRLGDAVDLYSSVAKMSATPQDAKAARDAAKLLTEKGRNAIAAAELALNAKNYAMAAKQFVEVSVAFSGHEFGKQASEHLKTMEADPIAARAIAQARLDAEADSLEAQAIAAEQSQNYSKAMEAYELCVSKYPTAHRVDAVKAKLAALQSNKTIQAGIGAKHADADCRSWLSLADNFIQSGIPEKARPYLQKIIDTYGDTPWADQARERLKQLDR